MKKDDVNSFIAYHHREGKGNKEITTMIADEFGIHYGRSTVGERVRFMRSNGTLGKYSCLYHESMGEAKEKVAALNEVIAMVSPTNKPMGITEAELRAKHDNTFILREKVKTLQKGMFIQDADFINLCQFRSGTGYRQACDHPEFQDYKGSAGGRVYWGCKEDIERLKREGVLR